MYKDVIGFVGLGAMGWHMAWRLAFSGQFRVVYVWNRTRQKALNFKEAFENAATTRTTTTSGSTSGGSKTGTGSSNGPWSTPGGLANGGGGGLYRNGSLHRAPATASTEAISPGPSGSLRTQIIVVDSLAELWQRCRGGVIGTMLLDDKATESVVQALLEAGAHNRDRGHHHEPEGHHALGDATVLMNCATVSPECVARIEELVTWRSSRENFLSASSSSASSSSASSIAGMKTASSETKNSVGNRNGVGASSTTGGMKNTSSTTNMKMAASPTKMGTMATTTSNSLVREGAAEEDEEPRVASKNVMWSSHEVAFCNACVTGRPVHAERGQLCSWVSASQPQVVSFCSNHIAACWSKQVRIISDTDPTASARFKIATNFLIYGLGELLGESLLLLESFDLPRESLLDWTSAMMPDTLLDIYARKMVHREFDAAPGRPVGASLDVGLKDLGMMKQRRDERAAERPDSGGGMKHASSCSSQGSPASKRAKTGVGYDAGPSCEESMLDIVYRHMAAQKKASGTREREWVSFLEQIEKQK